MSLKQNIRFNLHNPASENPTPIYLIYHFQNNRLCYSTGEKIHPRYWINERDTQRPKIGKELPSELPKETIKSITEQNRLISNKLINIDTALKTYIQTFIKSYTVPDVRDLKIYLDKYLQKKIKPVRITKAENTLIGYYEEYVDDMKSGKRINRKNNGRKMADSYIKSHGTTITNIKNYEKEKNKEKNLRFEDITLDWYTEFVQMLEDEGKAFNTIGCQIKNFKNFLKYSHDKGFHTNKIFTDDNFIVMREETDNIYLTEDELKRIIKLNLSKDSQLDNVRDLFILACYTGLRYSDFSTLKSTDIIQEKLNYILEKKYTQKTGTKVSIPLKKCVVDIYKKYNWNLPKALSNQKMNVYLKDIGKLAKINNDVELTKTYNNKRIGVTKPKYEFIGCHTARRTLATNMYLADFSDNEIMSITGHKNSRDFRNYIKADSLDKAKKMLKNRSAYFK